MALFASTEKKNIYFATKRPFPLQFQMYCGKTRVISLPVGGKYRDMCNSFRHNTDIGRTDGRTNGWTEMVKQYRTLYAGAS